MLSQRWLWCCQGRAQEAHGQPGLEVWRGVYTRREILEFTCMCVFLEAIGVYDTQGDVEGQWRSGEWAEPQGTLSGPRSWRLWETVSSSALLEPCSGSQHGSRQTAWRGFAPCNSVNSLRTTRRLTIFAFPNLAQEFFNE